MPDMHRYNSDTFENTILVFLSYLPVLLVLDYPMKLQS